MILTTTDKLDSRIDMYLRNMNIEFNKVDFNSYRLIKHSFEACFRNLLGMVIAHDMELLQTAFEIVKHNIDPDNKYEIKFNTWEKEIYLKVYIRE